MNSNMWVKISMLHVRYITVVMTSSIDIPENKRYSSIYFVTNNEFNINQEKEIKSKGLYTRFGTKNYAPIAKEEL